MSQSGVIDIVQNTPSIPTSFVTDSGTATPALNTLNVLGGPGITTSGSGDTVTISLAGGSTAIDSIAVQTGTSPVVPTVLGLVTINGATVAAGTNPVRSDGTGANTLAIEVQTSQAIAATDATKIGLCNFNSAQFTVDANGFVSTSGAGVPNTITGNSGGALSPTAGNWNILGTGSITTSGAVSTLTASLTGLTNHAVLVGAGTATMTKLAVGTNGQVLIGATAADPAFATITSTGGSIAFTLGANTLNMEAGAAVPTTFTANSGSAVPALNNINILGASTAAGTSPVSTAGAGSTITVNVQKSQAIASTDATKVGLANFDSASFDVDANGFVQLNGGGIAATSFDVQANTAPGTDPVVPTAAGLVTVNGAAVANHSVVLESRSRAANAYNLEIQYATSAAATDATKSGVAHFDSTDFSVDANGFVALAGAGAGQTITGNSGGALAPTAGNWNILGASTAAGTSPVTTSGAVSTLTINVQKAQALAATDATKVGLANFDSASFAVDANGFVTLAGGTQAIDSIGVDATSGAGTNPVLPTAGGLVTVNGARVAAGTNPIRSVSTAANVYQVQVQTAQALAATDATKVGLANFDSADFAVDANGFVTAALLSVVTPGAYPYTTLADDALILVDTSSARTIIPMAAPATGRRYTIKDSVGSAAANNITITPSGKNVDGAASQTINIAYGSATLIYNGTEWSLT